MDPSLSHATIMNDTRIQTLTHEVNRLRNSHDQADNQLHALLVKITEVQLNLATQDRILSKLDTALQGDSQPGLITRVDRAERVIDALTKSMWLLATTIAAGIARLLFERWK